MRYQRGPMYALVTGASSGIGLELCRELARRGYSLVLVGIEGPALADAAARLAEDFKVATQTVVIDLARPEAAHELHAEVQRRGLTIDVLANNAGFFLYGDVADADPARVNAMLQLHVVTPTLLCRLFGRAMRERKTGHVLIVSSISAWADFPGIALYGGSKRYLRSFAASLRAELRLSGVNVTLLAPGATATPLYKDTAVPVETATRLGVMVPAAFVARRGVEGMLKRRAVVIPGAQATLGAWLVSLLPGWIVARTRRFMWFLPRPS